MTKDFQTGDSCWFFNGFAIQEFILTGIDQQEGCYTRMEGHFPGRDDQRVIMTMPYPIFHSREEVCEYYKKIFG